MKKLLIILLSFCVFHGLKAQIIEDVKKDIYYNRYETAKNKLAKLITLNEVNPDVYYWLGEIYLEQGKIDSAYKIYMGASQILQKEYSKKESPLAYIGWAHLLLDSGKTADAKMLMESILKETKYKNTTALLAIARANTESKNGDINLSVELLNKAIDRDKKNPALYNALGDVYRKLTDGSNAVRNYDMALEMDKDNAEAMYKIGKIYKTQNNPDVYLEKFNKAYEMDSLYTPVLYELYQYYFYTDVINAQKFLDKYLANADPDPSHLYWKADLLYASAKYQDAIIQADSIKMRDKDTVQPRLYKLIAYCNAALGDSTTALKNINQYFKLQDTANYVAKDFALKAKLLENEGKDTSEIIAQYKKALLLETDKKSSFDYLTSLANLASAANNKQEEAVWREQLYLNKEKPSNVDIYKWGMALYQSGNFVKADSVFAIYEEKYPDQVYGYLYRAKSNTFLDSTMEKGLAVPFYTKLLDVAGKDAEKNKRLLVMAYEYLGAYEANITKDYSASLGYFDKLLQLDPENQDAANNTQLIKKWMNNGKQDN